MAKKHVYDHFHANVANYQFGHEGKLRFTAEMSKVFNHMIQGKDASMRLFSLRQGFWSMAEYAIDFRTLAAESGWNGASQQAAFVNGLSELLKY